MPAGLDEHSLKTPFGSLGFVLTGMIGRSRADTRRGNIHFEMHWNHSAACGQLLRGLDYFLRFAGLALLQK